jgi:hypothetical protein
MPDWLFYGSLALLLLLWAVISLLHARWRHKQLLALRKELEQDLIDRIDKEPES